jgi:hypothetical protein
VAGSGAHFNRRVTGVSLLRPRVGRQRREGSPCLRSAGRNVRQQHKRRVRLRAAQGETDAGQQPAQHAMLEAREGGVGQHLGAVHQQSMGVQQRVRGHQRREGVAERKLETDGQHVRSPLRRVLLSC